MPVQIALGHGMISTGGVSEQASGTSGSMVWVQAILLWRRGID